MIVKITRGGDMRGAVAYLAADKEGVRREDPRVVAGLSREGERLDAESIAAITSDLDDPRRLFGTEVVHQGKPGHVWACALALDKDADGVLSDERWREIADEFMRRMDFGNVRWVAVRHGLNAGGHDHVHIVAGLVREDGRAANDWRDQVRASRAANAIERKFGLSVNESRELGVGARGASRPALERAAKLGRESESHYLERVVRGCAIEARDEHEFVREVRAHGVKIRPRMAKGSSGRVIGYSVRVGEGPWYGGGRLARDLTLPRLRQQWGPAVPGAGLDVQAHRAAGQLAAWSIRTEREPGPIARQSRELGRFAQTRAGVPLVLTAAMATALRQRLRTAEREAEHQRELDELEERRRSPRSERDIGLER